MIILYSAVYIGMGDLGACDAHLRNYPSHMRVTLKIFKGTLVFSEIQRGSKKLFSDCVLAGVEIAWMGPTL